MDIDFKYILTIFGKYIVSVFGLFLFAYSIWFWTEYGRPIKIIIRTRFPPITTTVVITAVFVFILLMFYTNLINLIFGSETKEIRKNILQIIGVTYTGFILTMAIFWGLMAGKVRNISRAVYRQSYLLVLLFFYIGLAVCCILAQLP